MSKKMTVFVHRGGEQVGALWLNAYFSLFQATFSFIEVLRTRTKSIFVLNNMSEHVSTIAEQKPSMSDKLRHNLNCHKAY